MKLKKILSVMLAMACVVAMSIPVMAQDINVAGEIGIQDDDPYDPDNPSPNYKLTFNSTNVKWYVTENSNHEVVNDVDATVNDTTKPNTITNAHESIAYKVTLKEFVQSSVNNNHAATIASDLTLELTGDLALVGNPNLSGGYTTETTYSADLLPGAGNKWAYGFTGTYTPVLTATTYNPEYVMELGFAFAD